MNIKNNIANIDKYGLAFWKVIAHINIGGTDGTNHNKDLSNLSSQAISSNAKRNSTEKDIIEVTLYSNYYESGSQETSPSEDKPFWKADIENKNVLFYVPTVTVTRI